MRLRVSFLQNFQCSRLKERVRDGNSSATAYLRPSCPPIGMAMVAFYKAGRHGAALVHSNPFNRGCRPDSISSAWLACIPWSIRARLARRNWHYHMLSPSDCSSLFAIEPSCTNGTDRLCNVQWLGISNHLGRKPSSAPCFYRRAGRCIEPRTTWFLVGSFAMAVAS